MASRSEGADAPDIVGQIILLRPDEIDASGRMRPIDPVWAEALVGVMKAEGQRTPVEVCRLPGKAQYRLVTGGHRHAAATLAGLRLRCEVVTNDAAERRLREVSENLHRRDLAPVDRAAAIAELVALHKARTGIDPYKDGRAVSVSARWEKELKKEADDTTVTMTVVYGWADAVASGLGYSKSVVERDLLLHRRLNPEVATRLRGHPIERNAAQLRALAKLAPDDQRRAAALILDGNVRNVSEAVAVISGKRKPDAASKRYQTIIGTLARMSIAERRALVQSPAFHNYLPGEARTLLASLCRDGRDAESGQ